MLPDTLHSDVLIVGAGSAGSVLAALLSADPGCAVTVLEAGPAVADPGLQAQLADGFRLPIGTASPLVRRYRTELTGEPGGVVAIVRGSTVGGSGAVNGGYFCRGLPSDFDRLGLSCWSWDAVADHYRAIETDLDFNGPAHGDRGPIPVQRTREILGSTELFVAAADRAGFGWIADLNAPEAGRGPGVGPVPLNIADGRRVGPGTAYLAPALSRPNLTLLSGMRVLRVAIGAGRAFGVDAVGATGPVRFTADRIVLSAGAIESAHLLMLSGIGPEKMLRDAGIAVTVPLPVGSSCIDHPEWVLPVDWPVAARRPVIETVLHTEGLEIRPYTGGFVSMVGDVTSSRPDRPHIGVALMQPRSRGLLTLVSADPLTPLRIQHRYDSEPEDVAELRAGVQLVREMVGSAVHLAAPIWSTSQHLCGSAAMGDDRDEAAVLDQRCAVRGVDGLWVVDGSVLPRIVSRGPHATIVMIAHRAAEFLRG